jgi:hypothetical protein
MAGKFWLQATAAAFGLMTRIPKGGAAGHGVRIEAGFLHASRLHWWRALA